MLSLGHGLESNPGRRANLRQEHLNESRPGRRLTKIFRVLTNKFTVVRPAWRVNVDLTQGALRELDARAARLNSSRQYVIKTHLGRDLNDESVDRDEGKGERLTKALESPKHWPSALTRSSHVVRAAPDPNQVT